VTGALGRAALQRAVAPVPAPHTQAGTVLALAVQGAPRITLPALALLPGPACPGENIGKLARYS
jgi:hypothetical protein